jgi:hypothetical protein
MKHVKNIGSLLLFLLGIQIFQTGCQEKQNIQSIDVPVIGGETGGVAAGISAARGGAKVPPLREVRWVNHGYRSALSV